MTETANQLLRPPDTHRFPPHIIIATLANHWNTFVHQFANSNTNFGIRHHIPGRIQDRCRKARSYNEGVA